MSLAMLTMALSLGLYVTHALIPPTPGPVAAAGILGADLGLVILLGIPVSLVGLITGWLFAIKVASKSKYAIEQSPDSTEDIPENISEEGPSMIKSLMPVFMPILLIVFRSVNELPSAPFGKGTLSLLISFIGQPSVALLLGVGLSFLLPVKLKREMLSTSGWLGQGIIAAAIIIIVTGCGGAFGNVLQASGIADMLKNNLSGAQSLGILLPIIIAAALKIAQGSGTVSIITTASLMAPLMPSLGLDTAVAKAMVVVAIGSGAMFASHANDSYFWVVTQMSGMNVKLGYRLQTAGTLITGIITSIAVWAFSFVVL